MAKSKFLQSSFVSGELSPLLKGRVDLDQYYQGMETAENVLIVPQGGLKRRAGTQHVDLAEKIIKPFISSEITASMPEGGTVANINDFNPATVGLTTTSIEDLGTGSEADYIVAFYNIAGQSSLGKFIDVKDIKLSGTGSGAFKIQTSSDNSSWSTAKTLTVTAEAQSIRIKLSNLSTAKYFRIIRTGDTGDLGTLKIQLSEFNVLYATSDASDVKTFDFSVETDRHYLCVITGGADTSPSYGNMAIYRVTDQTANFLPVAHLPLPFKSTEVADVRDVQTENVMLMFHEDHAPKRIINTSTTTFTIDDIPFLNVPQFDYNDASSPTPTSYVTTMTLGHFQTGDRFQIDVEGVLSKNITFAGDSSANEQSSSAFNIEKNLQEMPIFGDTGVSVSRTGTAQYTITISGESTKVFELFSGFATSDSGGTANEVTFALVTQGVPRKENVWSDTRGYPKTAAFHAGRLWFGGTKSKLQSLFASRSGSFFDFFTEEGDDDEGIFITISSRQLTEIIDINPDRGLQVFTAGAEFVVNGSTPSDISVQSQTQHGASYLEVKSVDGSTLFVDQNGRTLRSFLYNYNEDAYNSTDISVLSSHLIDTPADVGVLSGSLSEDANWVFIVNQDGTSSVLNTLRSQDINGFTKWINGDTGTAYPIKTVSVSVVNNDLFLVNKRTTDTTTTYTVEKWDFDYLLDSSVKIIDRVLVPDGQQQVLLQTDHLTGFTVSVVVRGVTLPSRVVQPISGTDNNGKLIITAEEETFIRASGNIVDVEAGFNFTPKIKGMPLNTSGPAGQNQMREKKITRMNLRVYKSSGVQIDGNPVAIRQFGDAANTPLDSNLPEQTGIIQDNNGGNGWNIEVQPEITVPNPTPFHIQAIEYEVESS